MPCYYPISAFRTVDGSIVFNELRKHDIVSTLSLPCAQCVGCRLERSRQWAIRCIHEASLHDDNCFITLTYNDDNLPPDNSLNYRHFQLFMKRLRFCFPFQKIRFYMAGEYGEQFGRPHFHACIFGLNFDDKVLLRKSPSGSMLYRSSVLEELWTYGYSSIGDVTFESAAYVARYIMKKITGNNSATHYEGVDTSTGEVITRTPEFNKMSLKPGVGAGWYGLYKSDVYPHDYVVIKGKKLKPPKYYDKLFKLDNPFEWDEILFSRETTAKLHVQDQTLERLAVQATVLKARLTKLKRTLT